MRPYVRVRLLAKQSGHLIARKRHLQLLGVLRARPNFKATKWRRESGRRRALIDHRRAIQCQFGLLARRPSGSARARPYAIIIFGQLARRKRVMVALMAIAFCCWCWARKRFVLSAPSRKSLVP